MRDVLAGYTEHQTLIIHFDYHHALARAERATGTHVKQVITAVLGSKTETLNQPADNQDQQQYCAQRAANLSQHAACGYDRRRRCTGGG
jgi:hypothetical protein